MITIIITLQQKSTQRKKISAIGIMKEENFYTSKYTDRSFKK